MLWVVMIVYAVRSVASLLSDHEAANAARPFGKSGRKMSMDDDVRPIRHLQKGGKRQRGAKQQPHGAVSPLQMEQSFVRRRKEDLLVRWSRGDDGSGLLKRWSSRIYQSDRAISINRVTLTRRPHPHSHTRPASAYTPTATSPSISTCFGPR